MQPIIKSLLDVDFYKLTMLQAYFHQYPNATGKWEFRCRNKDVKLGFLVQEIWLEIQELTKLRLTKEERVYLESTGLYKEDFLDWFQDDFSLDISHCYVGDHDGELKITVRGLLTEVNLLEVYILSIVNELYFRHDLKENNLYLSDIYAEGFSRLEEKAKDLNSLPDLKFAEFGTRRRYSHQWQDEVIRFLVKNCPNNIIGTSNVYFAMKHGLKPIGTVAHSWTMSHLGLVDNISQAQSRALHVWQQEYGEKLGIALSDTFTTDAFLKDFNYLLSSSYNGIRQDSGDPIEFGEKMIAHYRSLGIDPKTKNIVFSDSLNINKAIDLYRHFAERINVSFGIGTSLTNSVGRTPLNIVMKLLECNGVPLVKLSDDLGKTMGDEQMVEKVKVAYYI